MAHYAYPAPTRLLWYRTYGVARCDGAEVDLRVPPELPGLDGLTEIDYVPGSVATVRIGDDAIRELESREIADIEQRLKRMAIGGRAPWRRGP